MEDCVFCKIVRGEIPSYKIYENETTLAFLDISKDIDGHTLVIPKNHCTNVLDCQEDSLNDVMKTVKLVSKHYCQNCGYDGVNILNANNKASGQSVFHLHFHILPRKNNDNENAWPKLNGAKNELSTMCEKLKI